MADDEKQYRDTGGASLGPSTDARNQPVIDPTRNVLDLVQAAIQRQDDLREITHRNTMAALGSGLANASGLCDEKFESVNKQLELVERQRVEQKQDTKAAVDAALAAAKEAVKEQTTASALSITKSETATAEQLKQLTVTFTTAISGVTSSFSDLKTRVERIENVKQGGKDAYYAIAGLATFILTVLVIVGIVAAAGGFTR